MDTTHRSTELKKVVRLRDRRVWGTRGGGHVTVRSTECGASQPVTEAQLCHFLEHGPGSGLNLLVPQFLHLENGDNSTSHTTRAAAKVKLAGTDAGIAAVGLWAWRRGA